MLHNEVHTRQAQRGTRCRVFSLIPKLVRLTISVPSLHLPISRIPFCNSLSYSETTLLSNICPFSKSQQKQNTSKRKPTSMPGSIPYKAQTAAAIRYNGSLLRLSHRARKDGMTAQEIGRNCTNYCTLRSTDYGLLLLLSQTNVTNLRGISKFGIFREIGRRW